MHMHMCTHHSYIYIYAYHTRCLLVHAPNTTQMVQEFLSQQVPLSHLFLALDQVGWWVV